MFQLSYGGRVSASISSDAEASIVMKELERMLSFQCSYSPPKGIFVYMR